MWMIQGWKVAAATVRIWSLWLNTLNVTYMVLFCSPLCTVKPWVTVQLKQRYNMAERRMFAKSVIGSGRFLQMPPTSRLLYYDLGMAADDDGIVEAFTVIRTTEEVAAYVRERSSIVDPQGFIDFYAAKEWMVGKNPMKDWKAACRNAEHWERWQRGSTKNEVKTASDYESGDDFFAR